jgi:hypothetical protein
LASLGRTASTISDLEARTGLPASFAPAGGFEDFVALRFFDFGIFATLVPRARVVRTWRARVSSL